MTDFFDYAEAKADADELIAEFGQVGLLRRPTKTGTAYNPTEGVPIEQACTFAIVGFKVREIDGSRILATDKKAIIAKGALTMEPTKLTDFLVDAAGKSFKIIDVEPLDPAGTVVFYKAQVRR